jgi:hypothetical protein
MKRFMIPRVSHCKGGCPRPSRAGGETACGRTGHSPASRDPGDRRLMAPALRTNTLWRAALRPFFFRERAAVSASTGLPAGFMMRKPR